MKDINTYFAYTNKVYCIAAPHMKADEIDDYVVDGLGFSRAFKNDPTYIVFCKSRAMCKTFYKRYWMDLILPWLKALRTEVGDDDSFQVVNCDGEDVQISVLGDATVHSQLTNLKIIVDKPPGSTTEITQSLDRGPLFKSVKKILKSVFDSDVSNDTKRFGAVSKIWAEHQTKYNSPFSAAHQRMGIYGVLRLSLAFSRGWSPVKAVHSFELTGQCPYDRNVILRNCTTPLTPKQTNLIFKALPVLEAKYVANGKLTKEDFDLANIPNNSIGKEKDLLTMSRQRTVRLSHPLIFKDYELALALRAAKASAKARKLPPASKPRTPYKPRKKRAKRN